MDRWLCPPVGLADDPEQPWQGPLRIDLLREGHLAVFGAPGTGKTTFLQTLALSLALAHSPADVHLYAVDAGGRGLLALAGLPHVGAALVLDDPDRLRRLWRLLDQELGARQQRLAAAGVQNLAAYREAGGHLPALVLLVDNLPALAAVCPEAEDALARLARDGAGAGIYLVLSAPSPAAVRPRILQNVAQAVTFALADRGEYAAVLGRAGVEPGPAPGRGAVRGAPPLLFQAALPAAGSDRDRHQAMAALAAAMAAAWQGPRPRPVPALPAVVHLSDLVPPTMPWQGPPAAVPVALDVARLEPLAVALAGGPSFAVVGPPGSGKSTLLQSWLVALATVAPPGALRLWLVDLGAGGLAPLASLPHVAGVAASGGDLEGLVAALAGQAGDGAVHVVAVDDLGYLREAPAPLRDRLDQLVRRRAVHMLAAGLPGAWQGFDALTQTLRSFQAGFVLGSADGSDLALLGARVPPGEGGQALPPGTGFYVRRGHCQKVRVATAGAGEPGVGGWVARLAARAAVPAG